MNSKVADFVEAHGRAMVLIVLAFAMSGLFFIFKLPISIFPQTDFPRIVVLVDNGITPPDIQLVTVTRPIEEAIRLVPGITTVRSVTARGSTEINVFFRWDVDILNALHLVQGRISQITPSLPSGARFYINRLTFSVFPMVGFSITSPTRTPSDLWELAYYDLAPRLYRLPGVAETRIVGGRPPEYHVLVDPQKLNSYGMPLTRVVDAIRNSNIINPSGMLQEILGPDRLSRCDVAVRISPRLPCARGTKRDIQRPPASATTPRQARLGHVAEEVHVGGMRTP